MKIRIVNDSVLRTVQKGRIFLPHFIFLVDNSAVDGESTILKRQYGRYAKLLTLKVTYFRSKAAESFIFTCDNALTTIIDSSRFALDRHHHRSHLSSTSSGSSSTLAILTY
jgi:hypothetical protein